MAEPLLTVVVPCFNEALRVPASLTRIRSWLEDEGRLGCCEILVVDDGSSDDTAGAASEAGGARAQVLRHPGNRGKGAAVRTGFAASRGARVLLTDADLSSPIEELGRLETAGAGTLAIGSRAVDRSLITVRQPLHRDLLGRCFNLIVRSLLVPGIADTQCGFKLYPGAVARQLAAVQRIDGFAFDVEHLTLARQWGVPVVEVPVRWAHVEASRVHALRHSGTMFAEVLGLALRRWTGRLPRRPEAG